MLLVARRNYDLCFSIINCSSANIQNRGPITTVSNVNDKTKHHTFAQSTQPGKTALPACRTTRRCTRSQSTDPAGAIPWPHHSPTPEHPCIGQRYAMKQRV